MPLTGLALPVVGHIKLKHETIPQTYELNGARLHSSHHPELLAQIQQARWERWANKMHDLELGRRGELLAQAIR